MKKLNFLTLCICMIMMVTACQPNNNENSVDSAEQPYVSISEPSSKIESELSASSEQMLSSEAEDVESDASEDLSEQEVVQSSKLEISEPPKAESSQPVENPSSNPKEGAPDTQQWVESLKKARGIDDFSDYSAAIYELNEQIETSLEDTQYGGTGQIREVFTDEKTNETTILTIGLKIFYIDIDKVKPVVTKIESNFTSVGKIDIEYIKCKYTLNELKEFAKEIQSQDFFEKYVSELSVYEGKVYARVKVDSKYLENFLSDKPCKDAVAIRSESTEPNPAT